MAKSTKHNQDKKHETVTYYATLMREEQPDALNSPNHHMDIIYITVDVNNKRKATPNIKNLPYLEEKKRHVALEDMNAIVNKQQKKKQNEDSPPIPVYSNTVDGVYYNAAAIRKEHTVEYEEVAPQMPPHAIEKATYSSCEEATNPPK